MRARGEGGMLRTPLHSHAASTEADKPSSHCDHFLSSMSKPAQPKVAGALGTHTEVHTQTPK